MMMIDDDDDDDQLSKVVLVPHSTTQHLFNDATIVCSMCCARNDHSRIAELQIIAHGTRIGINEENYFLRQYNIYFQFMSV